MDNVAVIRWKDRGDGTFAQDTYNADTGSKDDAKQTDPDQDATVISLLKGNLQVALDIKAELVTLNAAIAAGINVDIL